MNKKKKKKCQDFHQIRNEYIRGTAQVEQFGAKVREANMVWTCVEDRQWIYWTKDFEDREEQLKEEEKKRKRSLELGQSLSGKRIVKWLI